jgi:hypothetical protein
MKGLFFQRMIIRSGLQLKIAENGHFKVVKRLLSNSRVDPSSEDDYANSRVDPAQNNDYAIRMATAKGHLEVVKLLISDLRVNASSDDDYAIQTASQNGHFYIET